MPPCDELPERENNPLEPFGIREIQQGVVIGVLVSLATTGLLVLFRKGGRWTTERFIALRRQRANTTHEKASERRRALRTCMIDCAKSKGLTLAVTRRGSNPTEITYADDAISKFFDRDHFEAYQAALPNYRYDPRRTFWNKPRPLTVDRMTESQAGQWLKENCD